jgi:hypothetical protein
MPNILHRVGIAVEPALVEKGEGRPESMDTKIAVGA